MLFEAVAGPMLDTDPYPAVHEALFDRAVLDALPETRTRGLINMGPEFGMARQVVREALALLEVNLLVYRLTSSDSMRVTRRGHVAIRSGDVRGAMTTAR